MPGKPHSEPSGQELLASIAGPADLKGKSNRELTLIAEAIREQIIGTVRRRGGHLASNLGTVELTCALHAEFDFAYDRLLWDVGHQCYAHKILTGRRGRFDDLRQAGGISGFPDPAESNYDLFATGHAGTAISLAYGLARADGLAGRGDRKIVAVVGDAAIANGVSMEAINSAGLLQRQFLVILNDNSMAIDVTQGALANVLDRLRMTHAYSELKERTEQLLRRLPLGGRITETIRHIKQGLGTTVHGEQVFEALGLRYFGPMDGHDIGALRRALRKLRRVEEPVLLHVHTQKGHGCDYAVEDPCRFHSPAAHSVNGGVVEFAAHRRPTWTEAFSRALLQRARAEQRIVAITAAMPDGTGLSAIRDALPDRYLDVGISESHAVALAGGLAKAGLRPVVAIYSTFLQRAFDQISEEVCLQHLPVIFCIDRAGLVGADGPVHHGSMDLSYLRPLPGMVLMAPADRAELNSALDLALTLDGPSAIRYPRDEVPPDLPGSAGDPYRLGRARLLRAGEDGPLLALGAMVEHALAAAKMLSRQHHFEAAVYSARFAKPLDEPLVCELIRTGRPMLVVEDHATAGGFGSAVMELAAARGLDAGNVRLLGLPDRFIAHARRAQQLAEAGLDAEGVAAAMLRAVAARSVEHHAK